MIDLKDFPTTRYQGSKRKMLPFLAEVFEELDFDTVLDACGGSGSVSFLLKKMGKVVTYNDKLHFNYLIGKALIENNTFKLTDQDIANLNSFQDYVTYQNFITETFEGVYYLVEENQWLDRMANNIFQMNHYQPQVLQYKKSLAYYALFQASMIKRPFNLFHRNNLQIRTNDVSRNFGNKTTWEKSFDDHFITFAKEVNRMVFDNGHQCRSTNESILDINPVGYDLVYIDPPYLRKNGSNESSQYLRCYHFLEGMSRYNEWQDLIDFDSINLRFRDLQLENDFKKETIYDRFDEIISRFRNSTIVLSYEKGGIPSIDFIIKTMRKYDKTVSTRSLHYKYALNKNADENKNREVVIIGV